MTAGIAFYLFVLPLVIAAVGAAVAYYGRTNHNHHNRLHPGE